MAIITRWRMPPESRCGYSSMRFSGAGMRTWRSISIAARRAAAALDAAMADQHLGELRADGEGRVQRGHRLLEDHRQPVAAQVGQGRLVERQQVAAFEGHAAGDMRSGPRQQAHDRQRRHALAAAGLADHAQGFAGIDREGHAVDRLRRTLVGAELHAQIVDRQQRRHEPAVMNPPS